MKFLLTLILLVNLKSQAAPSCGTSFIPRAEQDQIVQTLTQTKRHQEAIFFLKKMGRYPEAAPLETALLEKAQNLAAKILYRIKGDPTTEVYMVQLEDGTRGIFKPRSQYWRHVSKSKSYLNSADAEVAAYEMASVLGVPVPVTVERYVDNMLGSLQIFVERTQEPGKEGAILLSNYNIISLFDYLIKNKDRGGSHNTLTLSIGFYYMQMGFDHGAALANPKDKQGRHIVRLDSLNFNGEGVSEFMERLKNHLTPEMLTEILQKRNRHPKLIADVIRIRNLLLYHHENSLAPKEIEP